MLGSPPVHRGILMAASRAHPSLVVRPPRRSNTRVLRGFGGEVSRFWFEGGKGSAWLRACPADGLRSHACPLPPPATATKDQRPTGGDGAGELGAARGPRWVHTRLRAACPSQAKPSAGPPVPAAMDQPSSSGDEERTTQSEPRANTWPKDHVSSSQRSWAFREDSAELRGLIPSSPGLTRTLLLEAQAAPEQ